MEIIKRNTDYAIRALLSLYKQGKILNKSVKAISQECDIPEVFLHKILQKLNRAGIVQANRGAEGGYSIKKIPSSITVLEIMENVQGKFAINKCFMDKDFCLRRDNCNVKNKLFNVQKQMVNFLNEINLEMLASDEGLN